MIKKLKYRIPWKILFPFAVWQLWLHRNGFIFSTGVIDMKFILLCVGKSTEFSAIVPNLQPKPPRTSISFKWEPPESGWIKLNIDGASNSNLGRAGGGGLLRNSDDNWIRGFSRSMGTCSSLMVELWALKDGLYLAKELGFSSIYIEVDAKLIVGLLFNPSCVNLVMEPLLFDCRNLLQDFTNLVVRHVFREANQCADTLAKIGLHLSQSFVTFVDPPPVVEVLLAFDKAELYCTRMICA